jgi:hypothetical protein
MSELTFEVVGVTPERYCAAPTITFRVRIYETSGDSVYALALRTQIMIEPQRRRYTPEEEQRLTAQFGERERWGQTLKPFFWATVGTMVTAFDESIEIDIQVPLTYDWELASTKFLHGVETGEVPVNLLFNGTVVSKGDSGFVIEPVPWNKEARFGVPAGIWRATMDIYFPGTAWLRTARDTMDKLERFRTIRGLTSWERTFDVLIDEAREPNGLVPDAPPELAGADAAAAAPGDGGSAPAPTNGASS